LSPGVQGAQMLAAKIRSGSVVDGRSVRDLARHEWSGLTNANAVRDALRVLETAGWIRLIVLETEGRPTEVLGLHPRLRGKRDA
jgi:predicted transcriptional regulator